MKDSKYQISLVWAFARFVALPPLSLLRVPSAEEADLFADLHSLTRNSTLRKLNDLIKRAKLARVHALIVAELRAQMPLLLGKEQRRLELVAGLQDTFARVQKEHGVPAGLLTICFSCNHKTAIT